jgi:ubiquitin C-terminal hydrolase
LRLNLEPGKKSVEELFCSSFSKIETLSPIELFLCPKCGRKVQSTTQLNISSYPQLLVLTFPRFTFNKKKKKNDKASKNQTQISFSKQLTLPMTEDTESNVYNLAGVVVHVGELLHCGHYEAYVKVTYNLSQLHEMVISSCVL